MDMFRKKKIEHQRFEKKSNNKQFTTKNILEEYFKQGYVIINSVKYSETYKT